MLPGFRLSHFSSKGTDERRTEKFYDRLPDLIKTLEKKGYSFVSLDEILGNNS